MILRSSHRPLLGFVAIAAGLLVSDFAFAAFLNHFWRVAVCVLLVAAVSMMVLILRSLRQERNTAHELKREIPKAHERRLLRALVATAVSARNPNGRN